MPPHYISLKYFPRTRIKNRGPHRICLGRCGICQYRVVYIIHIHLHIIGNIFGYNGILKSGMLKSYLPVFNSLFDILPPPIRRRVFYIKYNGLMGLYQFTAQICFPVLRLWFKTPAGNELFFIHPLLTITEVSQRISKIPHARIIQTSGHRHFGKQQDRRTYLHCHVDSSSPFCDTCSEF